MKAFIKHNSDNHVSMSEAGNSIPFMVDDDQSATAAAHLPPTEQAPAPDEASSPTAYSAEPLDYDDPGEYPTELIVSRSWGVAAGIAALVVVLGAVVAVLVWLVGQPAPNTTVAIPAAPSSSVTVTPEAPPSPVPPTIVETRTVTAIPEAVPTTAQTVAATPVTPGILPPEVVAAYDRQFIAQLRGEGWAIWDEGTMTRNAHVACAMFQNGAPAEFVNNELSAKTGMPMDAALMFTSAAMLIYPNCP